MEQENWEQLRAEVVEMKAIRRTDEEYEKVNSMVVYYLTIVAGILATWILTGIAFQITESITIGFISIAIGSFGTLWCAKSSENLFLKPISDDEFAL